MARELSRRNRSSSEQPPSRSAAPTSSRYSKESTGKWGCRRRSELTKALSSCRATWIYRPTSVASRSTSAPPRQAYRQRVHRSVQQTPADRVPEHTLVPEPCGRSEKVRGLAQILQRRAPTWRDRAKASDYLVEPRWRSQPATVTEPEQSNLRRSSVGLIAKLEQPLIINEGNLGSRPRGSGLPALPKPNGSLSFPHLSQQT
jgi:hypothetical protein